MLTGVKDKPHAPNERARHTNTLVNINLFIRDVITSGVFDFFLYDNMQNNVAKPRNTIYDKYLTRRTFANAKIITKESPVEKKPKEKYRNI